MSIARLVLDSQVDLMGCLTKFEWEMQENKWCLDEMLSRKTRHGYRASPSDDKQQQQISLSLPSFCVLHLQKDLLILWL